MTKLQISVSSCTYKNGIFQGFSRLQQSDEFVDMTLAAEGHLVKVHQNLVALASPYLKNMLLSIPCRHPVIFLNGISHEVLGFILEYIYTGEVEIPAEKVQTFVNAAQAMYISGLKNIIPPAGNENSSQVKQTQHVFQNPQQAQTAAKPIIIQNDLLLQEPELPVIKSEIENQTGSLLQANNDNEYENIGNVDVAEIEILSEEIINVRKQLPPLNETNGQIPLNIDMPISLEVNKEFKSHRNINTCGESMNVNYNLNDDNTSKKPVAKIEILSEEIINVRKQLPPLSETDSQIPLNIDMPISLEVNKEFKSHRNINTCGKSINISYNNNMSMDNDIQKPVANIEIVSNILPNANMNAINNPGLPQLYANALANMEKAIGNDIIMDDSFSQFQNISNQLCAKQCNPMSEPARSDDVHIETNENHETESVLYTASNRGSLQLILNKFMYYCHYQRNNGRKRRWRCIDYRGFHCPASVDTEGEQIINRKHKHTHPNHDQKIRKKIIHKDSKIFSTIQMAEDVLGKQKTDNQ